jgi:hypothetical protein
MPDYQPVYGSSIVSAIAYHEGSRDCFVKFTKNNEVYVYHDVPPEVWEELLHASSKGKFVNLQLRRGYKYERVTAPADAEKGEADGKQSDSKI